MKRTNYSEISNKKEVPENVVEEVVNTTEAPTVSEKPKRKKETTVHSAIVTAAAGLNVRTSKEISNNIIGVLKKGSIVEVESESNGWSKIKYNNATAYCKSEFLK